MTVLMNPRQATENMFAQQLAGAVTPTEMLAALSDYLNPTAAEICMFGDNVEVLAALNKGGLYELGQQVLASSFIDQQINWTPTDVNQPLIITDVENDSRIKARLKTQLKKRQIKSLAIFYFVQDAETQIGCTIFYFTRRNAIHGRRISLLELLMPMIGSRIVLTESISAAVKATEEEILQLFIQLVSTNAPEDAIGIISAHAQQEGATHAALYYIEQDPISGQPQSGEFVSGLGSWSEMLPQLVDTDSWLIQELQTSSGDQCAFISDVTHQRLPDEMKRIFRKCGIRSVLIVPMQVDGQYVATAVMAWDEVVELQLNDLVYYNGIAQHAGVPIALNRSVVSSQTDIYRLATTVSESVNSGELVVVTLDPNGITQLFEGRSIEVLGIDANAYLDKPISEALAPFYPDFQTDFAEVLQNKQRSRLLTIGDRYVLAKLNPQAEFNKVERVVLVFVDVTERERLLTEKETLLKNMLQTVSHELKNPLTVIIGALDLTQELFDDLSGLPLLRSDMLQFINRLLNGQIAESGIDSAAVEKMGGMKQELYRLIMQFVDNKIGEESRAKMALRYVDVPRQGLMDAARLIGGVICSLIDNNITDLNVFSEPLQAAITRVIDEFIGKYNVFGQLPEDAIGKGNSALNESRKAIVRAHTSAQNLTTTIQSVLFVARLDAGKIILAPTDINVRKWFKELYNRFKPEAEKKGVKFILTIDPDVDEVINFDKDALALPINNLSVNACKFTEKGEITVKVSKVNNRIRVEVADTGIGIPADKVGDIFQDFVQVDLTSTRRHLGTGLGLSIVRNYARLTGGDYGVSSEYGAGSTFFYEFPLA